MTRGERVPSAVRENYNMSTPTLYEIAEELNVRARAHPIGTLQEIRGHRPGNDLFRVNSQTTQDRWACHWGDRTELQFNIGLEGTSKVRHGVTFSFESSRNYSSAQLVDMLKPKVNLFNKFLGRHSGIYADMGLRAEEKDGSMLEAGSGPIPPQFVAENVFVFFGKFQPINRIDYEFILKDFDRLLPLYQYVESRGKKVPISVPLEAHFSFRSGCRTKKQSAIIQQRSEQTKRDLRHNKLQEVLHRRLARQFGKENVGTEIQGVNGTSIDLVVRRKRGYWFYEIKTAPSTRACIREALGQLLEYAFWPGTQEATRLIVAAECPIDEDGRNYLRCIKDRFSLPLEYEQIIV
jgi:hypothetical protein